MGDSLDWFDLESVLDQTSFSYDGTSFQLRPAAVSELESYVEEQLSEGAPAEDLYRALQRHLHHHCSRSMAPHLPYCVMDKLLEAECESVDPNALLLEWMGGKRPPPVDRQVFCPANTGPM